jgi:hypothetical protein
MYSYGIGGNEVKLDASEAIADIPSNRTLLVQQFTEDAPPSPEAVYGLKTVEEVFDKFQPKVKVEFETADGETKEDELRFRNLGDFSSENIVQQSEFLNGLNLQQEQYHKIVRQLSSNKVLQKAMSDETTRNAVIQALEAALQELKTSR